MRQTAIAVSFTPYGHLEVEVPMTDVTIPPGFLPLGITASCEGFWLQVSDDEGVAFEIYTDSFKDGPLAFWRPLVGPIRLAARFDEVLSYFPKLVVTIFGHLPA